MPFFDLHYDDTFMFFEVKVSGSELRRDKPAVTRSKASREGGSVDNSGIGARVGHRNGVRVSSEDVTDASNETAHQCSQPDHTFSARLFANRCVRSL